jgi:phosphate-selective porin OprO and OprP
MALGLLVAAALLPATAAAESAQPAEPEAARCPVFTRLSGRFGARLHLDAAAFATTDDVQAIDADADVRRAFVSTAGRVATRWPLRYKIEVGIARQRFFLDSLWVEVQQLPGDVAVRVGQFDPPLSLENVTSSNAYTFLEMPQPVSAFAPGTKAGIQFAKQWRGARPVLWTFGYHADTQNVDVGDRSESPARVITRLTWAPRRFEAPERRRLLHLGLSLEYVVSSSTEVRYTARPESKLAPELLDTGELDASGAGVHGIEAALASGPWLFQTEYLGSAVQSAGDESPFFWGGYVMASRVLTGEARPYDRGAGAFGMLVPSSPVSPRRWQWRGAWEVGVRYSYLSLHSGGIRGGRSHAVSLGVNWSWSRHVRVMADYGATVIGGRPDDGSVHVFQTRLQLVY